MELMRIKKESESVLVYSDKDIIEKLKKLLLPYFEVSFTESRKPEEWVFATEINDTQSLGTKDVIEFAIKNLAEPKRKYEVYPEKKVIWIREPDNSEWKIQLLNRLIRDSLRNLLSGKLCYLHGAFVIYKEKGICILGEKRSGKTTSVLNFLDSPKCKFVSNDDVAILRRGEELVGIGWPRAFSLRKDSLEALEKIGICYRYPHKLEHPYNRNSLKEEYLTLFPYEFEVFAKTNIAERHSIDYFLFTEFSEESLFEELDYTNGLKRLEMYVEEDINKYFKEFEKYFLRGKVDLPHILDVKKIKFYHIQQKFTDLKNLGILFDEVIDV